MIEAPKKHGCVVLVTRKGERVSLSIDGEPLGYIELAQVFGEKARLAFCCDKRLRIKREPAKQEAGKD